MSDPFRPDALLGAPLMAALQAERPKLETPEATEAMKKAAAEFESMMLSEMLGPMFNALDANGFGGGGSGEEMFRPMLVENYAKGLQANGGIGIAQSVLAELVRMQTVAAPES